MPPVLAISEFLPRALLTSAAMATACAVLSVFVVSRRWAFIGEGIGHSGFGGAGTAWILGLIFPALDRPWVPFVAVVVFCLGTAIAIGFLARDQRVSADAAIGIFLVASLAWGILAQHIYMQVRHASPAGWDNFLFGQVTAISARYTLAAVMVCAAVVLVVTMLNKEIVYYCFDPLMARASGVRTGFIHYLLMILVALTIIVGTGIVGSVLVTALLVLPGATALLLTDRLDRSFVFAVGTGLIGAAGGAVVSTVWNFLPIGPMIVLTLFVEFLVAYGVSTTRRKA